MYQFVSAYGVWDVLRCYYSYKIILNIDVLMLLSGDVLRINIRYTLGNPSSSAEGAKEAQRSGAAKAKKLRKAQGVAGLQLA